MTTTRGYAVPGVGQPLIPFEFERREPGPADVEIEILYSGICHSDIHQARNEWGNSAFPMVPGHEILGRVARTGLRVKTFRPGDLAGVGCFVDSCRVCAACRDDEEQFCDAGPVFTYNSPEKNAPSRRRSSSARPVTRTFGGYSRRIVCDERYVLRIPPALTPLDRVAPLMCAGITTYAPLIRHRAGRGRKIGIVGLGGLGHLAVKLASSMGADVTVFSASPAKERDARRFGARRFVLTRPPANVKKRAGEFDLILDTVSANHDIPLYLDLLNRGGTMILVGVPEKPASIPAFSLIDRRRNLTGSLIGGIRETQEMLNYCARKKILPEVEVIPASRINEAYDRAVASDVRYRFVIDASTF